MTNIKDILVVEVKPGDYLEIKFQNGTYHTGELLELKEDHLVLENVEAYKEKMPDGKRRPNIVFNKVVVPYDQINYFVIVG